MKKAAPLIDRLSKELHDNWRESMRAAGVESCPARWDESEELNVPWESLSERAKEHNRDAVRQFARAFYEALSSDARC